MSDGHKFASNVGEGDLRRGGQTEEDGCTDQRVDILGSSSYNTSNETECSTSNEEVASAEDVRETSDQGISDGKGQCPAQCNPVNRGTWTCRFVSRKPASEGARLT